MLLAVVLLAAAATVPRSFSEEREMLDRRLAAVRRQLPDGPQPAADIAHINALADAALLRRASVVARAPGEAHGVGELAIDISAFGRFTSIETFFRQIMESPRLIDVDSLALASTPEDTIRLTATLKLPFWPAHTRLPAPPEGSADPARGVPRALADPFLRDQSLLLAKTESTVALRRQRRNPRLFLSEIADAARDRPIVLTELTWGNELFVARGYSMGEGPTRDLERRLENGYFRIAEFLMARMGGCRRFEARGRSPMVGPAIELPLAEDDPFRQDDAPCRVDRDTASSGDVIRAAGSKAKSAPGPLTIRGKEIDRADLFLVLHDLTGHAFVVDENVRGRIAVDLTGVTLDEAIAAMQRSGLYVGPGPVHRVSTSPIAATTAEVGPPLPQDVRVSLSLKRAGVRDVLSILAQAEPSLAASAPEGSLGYVSVFARDVDLRLLRQRVAESAGLSESVGEDGARTVFRGTNGTDPAVPIVPTAAPRRLLLHASDLSPDDFDLAVVAGVDGAWRAFAYSPAGSLHRYSAGDRLTDGGVRSVEPAAVVLETDDGPIWLRLATP
jgi:hypothetical protein